MTGYDRISINPHRPGLKAGELDLIAGDCGWFERKKADAGK